MLFEKIKVYAFVGPSGTGKSYRAQMVASEKNIKFSGHKSYICCYEIIIAKETNDSKQDFKENF